MFPQGAILFLAPSSLEVIGTKLKHEGREGNDGIIVDKLSCL